MFIHKVTVKIEKDKNYACYIKIIRDYDVSLSASQIKKAIDNGDVVFSFDPDHNPMIANGKDNSVHFLEYYFKKTIKELEKAGAVMTIMEGNDVCHEFDHVSESKKISNIEKTKETIMKQIEDKWKLPEFYLDFLKNNAESLMVDIGNEDMEYTYPESIEVYGANQLIDGQNGYSYNPVEKQEIDDWNRNYVVIANSAGDPFCINISKENSPVYYAVHGIGEWEFEVDSDTIEEFFVFLGIK